MYLKSALFLTTRLSSVYTFSFASKTLRGHRKRRNKNEKTKKNKYDHQLCK